MGKQATGGLYMAFHKAGQGAIECCSGSTARTLSGQGATEYLIMLAAILIIALVALALLGFFPGISSDAKVSQSASYWRSEAKPLSILEHQVTAGGEMTLVLLNVDASGTIRLKNVTVGDTFNDSFGATGFRFGPGEQRTIRISDLEGGDAGTMYEFPLNFTYVSVNGVTTTQYGVKTLVGKYS